MTTSDIANERVKLTANFMNAVAAGIVTVALVAPLVGMALGTMPLQDTWNIVGLSLFSIVTAIVVHLAARRVLSRLRQ